SGSLWHWWRSPRRRSRSHLRARSAAPLISSRRTDAPRVEWPASFYALKRGEGCPMCAQGRPDDVGFGVRFLAGDVADAYLQRADIQRGYTVVVWGGRHVVEPTELTDEEAAQYWLEVMRAGR